MRNYINYGLFLILVLQGCDFLKKKQFDLTEKPIYHIRVERWEKGYDYYTIRFTNNNWLTSEDIMEAFDTSYWNGEVSIATQTITNETPDYLIQIASGLNSYQDCINYNIMVDKKAAALKQHRINNPIVNHPRDEDKPEKKLVTINIK